jgi:thiamine-phosphate pyrophosphorylase
MFSSLTPAVARALQAAQEWAHRQGSPDVRPQHLLQGLLEEEEGRTATLLAQAGLDPAGLRAKLAQAPAGTTTLPTETPLPLSPAAETVLARARELAGQSSAERTVASEQLLLALLREDQVVCDILTAQGLVLARLETEVRTLEAPRLNLDEPLFLEESIEEMDAARILDVGANRAREALRVIEDYCRFVLDDAFLSREVKTLRHDLAEALANLPAGLLLEARDTLRDVGTAISTAAERERASLRAVVQANCKRLQEALRSLEEYGKLRSPELGQELERLRYHSYSLERAIILGTTARERLAEARLYMLLTGALCTAALDWTIKEAAAGGAQIVQLREKKLTDRDLLERARQVRRWTREAGVLFIMNDRPDIARLVEADGVHVGQEELPVKEVRRIVGPGALIGVSTHNLDQVRQAVLDGASYIGVGPTFPSGTKDFADFPGLDFARQAAAETSLPAFVIGGVNLDNMEQVRGAGLRRVAVSQAICQADDPRQAAAEIQRYLTGHS